MKLWTIQKEEVLEILEREGVYKTNINLVDNPEFFNAYDWLNNYLMEKSKKPEGINYPIWAWFRYNGKEKKPDLRHSAYAPSGTKCVCLELELPDSDVLLSDFDLWHFVLNNWWIDDSKNEDEWDKNQDWFNTLSYEKQEELKKKSWEKIFDIEIEINDWERKGENVQAVFWELKKEYVKKCWKFVAR